MQNKYSEAISEVLEVMKYMDEDLLNKIPLELINKLKSQRLETYVNKFEIEIDPDKLSDKAIDILAVIYRDYIANDEEKIEFDKMLDENELKGDGRDYTIKRFEKIEINEEEKMPAEIKKGFFEKLFEKIFRFKKNN